MSAEEPIPHVLVLTADDDPAYARAVLGAGAIGYVVNRLARKLFAAIRPPTEGKSSSTSTTLPARPT